MKQRWTIFVALVGVSLGLATGRSTRHPTSELASNHSAALQYPADTKQTTLLHSSGLPGDISHLALAASVTDLRTLCAQFDTFPEETQQTLVDRWLAVNPVAGVHFFLEKIDGSERSQKHASMLLAWWAKKDLASALRCALDVDFEVDTVLHYGAHNAPEAALAAWQQLPLHLRASTVDNLISGLSDFPEVRNDALQRFSANEMFAVLTRLSRDLPPADLWKLIAEKGVLNLRSPYAYESLIEKFQQTDPAAARAAVESMPDGLSKGYCQRFLVRCWAETNPAEALAWAQMNAPTPVNLAVAAAKLCPSDPTSAIPVLIANMRHYDAAEALANHYRKLANEDPAGVQQSLLALPTAPVQRAAASGLVQAISDQHLPLAEEYNSIVSLLKLLPENSRPGLNSIALRCTAPAELEAMAQRITQEPPELQAMLQDCIWQQWYSSEVPPDQIVNWLSTLAYESGRNQNLLISLSEWADRDPEAAASFAETFQDAALQSYAIAKAALAWFRINAPACEQWLDSFADPTLNKLAREEIAKLK